jgi:hypothetical protein
LRALCGLLLGKAKANLVAEGPHRLLVGVHGQETLRCLDIINWIFWLQLDRIRYWWGLAQLNRMLEVQPKLVIFFVFLSFYQRPLVSLEIFRLGYI